MPPNTVRIARPGRWGNPYPVAVYGLDLSLKLFDNTMHGIWSPSDLTALDDGLVVTTYNLHKAFRDRLGQHATEAARSELRGRNVACWCALDARCHGDILLKIANL